MKKIIALLPAFLFFGILLAQPLDDITTRSTLKDRRVLKYPGLRESDIMWEKRIWRVIDVREKMNQAFTYPELPFFTILQEAAGRGDITLYSAEDDKFGFPLNGDEVHGLFYSRDTIERFDPETYKREFVVVEDEVNFEDVKRFRIKEVWYFDENYGGLRVRILGIAPLIDVKDDQGNFRYEKPMFWAYYPECREILARKEVFNTQNDAGLTSWEDLFEMRYFASHIYKESNVHGARLQEFASGVDLLLEAEKIKQEIFNFEHDLWSY